MGQYFADYINELVGTERDEVKSALATVSSSKIVAQSGVAIPLTGTTAETALATISIAAGLMGANDSLLITTLWSYTNSANAKTPRVRLGGISGTAFTVLPLTTTATSQALTRITNRGSVSSQVGANTGNTGFVSSASAIVTANINMANSQDLVISGQLSSASETLTLESYTVELVRA